MATQSAMQVTLPLPLPLPLPTLPLSASRSTQPPHSEQAWDPVMPASASLEQYGWLRRPGRYDAQPPYPPSQATRSPMHSAGVGVAGWAVAPEPVPEQVVNMSWRDGASSSSRQLMPMPTPLAGMVARHPQICSWERPPEPQPAATHAPRDRSVAQRDGVVLSAAAGLEAVAGLEPVE